MLLQSWLSFITWGISNRKKKTRSSVLTPKWMYFIHSEQSKAEKAFHARLNLLLSKDVPPTELQCRKFQKETKKRPNIIVYMLLFFYSFSQPANDVFRQTFGPASISSNNHWTLPLKRVLSARMEPENHVLLLMLSLHQHSKRLLNKQTTFTFGRLRMQHVNQPRGWNHLAGEPSGERSTLTCIMLGWLTSCYCVCCCGIVAC